MSPDGPHKRRNPMLATALLVAVTACQANPPSTTTGPDLVKPAPSPGGGLPTLLAGSAQGGAQGVVVMLSAAGEVISIESLGAPEERFADAVVAGDQVHFSTCCEPASGLRWRTIDDTAGLLPLGFGQAIDGDSRRVLVVDPNGGYLRTDFIDEPPVSLTSQSGDWMPVDGALSRSGHTAVIALGGDGRGALFWVPPGSEFFDSDPPVVTADDLGGSLSRPAVDVDGDIWLVVLAADLEAPTGRVRVNPRTGEITDVAAAGRVADQEFDAEGRHLLTVYADGTVTWRLHTGDVETPLDLPPLDRADW